MVRHTDRVALGGVELEYEVAGAGEPVVLIHHGAGVGWLRPLQEQAELADGFRILTYQRVGYGGSSRAVGPVSFAEEAGHLRALLRHLGLEPAHVVGHSSSAMIALQLALDEPGSVQTLGPAGVRAAGAAFPPASDRGSATPPPGRAGRRKPRAGGDL